MYPTRYNPTFHNVMALCNLLSRQSACTACQAAKLQIILQMLETNHACSQKHVPRPESTTQTLLLQLELLANYRIAQFCPRKRPTQSCQSPCRYRAVQQARRAGRQREQCFTVKNQGSKGKLPFFELGRLGCENYFRTGFASKRPRSSVHCPTMLPSQCDWPNVHPSAIQTKQDHELFPAVFVSETYRIWWPPETEFGTPLDLVPASARGVLTVLNKLSHSAYLGQVVKS